MCTGGAPQHLRTPKPHRTFTLSRRHPSLIAFFFFFLLLLFWETRLVSIRSLLFIQLSYLVGLFQAACESGGRRAKRWRCWKVSLVGCRRRQGRGSQEWEEEEHPHSPAPSPPHLNPPHPYNFSLGASYKPTIYLHYAPEIAICRFAGKK